MHYFKYVFWLSLLLLIACENTGVQKKQNVQTSEHDKDILFGLEKIVENVISPVGIENAGDGTNRLFIVSQNGKIHVLKNGEIFSEPFLDLNGKMVNLNNTYSERGLLGLAFHPQYKKNGRFFVYYSAESTNSSSNNQSVIAEYKVSAENPDRANHEGRILLTIDQPENNHNGGSLVFGPDGYLYIGSGDGGGKGDQHGQYGNAQNLENLLGKILRIDIDHGKPYGIPSDNPFQGKSQKPEIYAYGLRNPWRMSFDPISEKLFVADVGQDNYEEIDIVEKGKNYGWRYMEGYHVYDESLKGIVKNSEYPIHEYDHTKGKSVTGGYVYTGTAIRELFGCYVFADWEGSTWYLQQDVSGKWNVYDLKFRYTPTHYINSFGQDEHGELYMATQPVIGAVSNTGIIYKIVK
jgi:glucose/arabinose dehydrogenase